MKTQGITPFKIILTVFITVSIFFFVSCKNETKNDKESSSKPKKSTYKILDLKDRIHQPQDSLLQPGTMQIEAYNWRTIKQNIPLLKVYTPNGVEVVTNHAVLRDGTHWIDFDYSELTTGAYRLEFTDKNGLINSYYGVLTEHKIGDQIDDYPCSSNFLKGWDFNGDHIIDHVDFEYTHGAHCCYKIILQLGGSTDTTHFPFEMDGHYECGVDESQPDEFFIKDYDADGLPEIMMMIQTYNEDFHDIPKVWQTKYGISENYILIDYKNDKWEVRDFKIKQ